jgi:hypothetical protein
VTLAVLVLVFVCGGSIAYFWPLRMPMSLVRLTDGTCLSGLYLGRDADGVHLADGKNRKILTIAASDLVAVQIGHFAPATSTPIARKGCAPPAMFISPGTIAGDSVAAAYLARIIELQTTLSSAITLGWRIQPSVSVSELDVPSVDSGPILNATVSPATLADLGRLHGQLAITYGGWRRSASRVPLTPLDRRRVCRTIALADRVAMDMKSLPGNPFSHFKPISPPACSRAPF